MQCKTPLFFPFFLISVFLSRKRKGLYIFSQEVRFIAEISGIFLYIFHKVQRNVLEIRCIKICYNERSVLSHTNQEWRKDYGTSIEKRM